MAINEVRDVDKAQNIINLISHVKSLNVVPEKKDNHLSGLKKKTVNLREINGMILINIITFVKLVVGCVKRK